MQMEFLLYLKFSIRVLFKLSIIIKSFFFSKESTYQKYWILHNLRGLQEKDEAWLKTFKKKF